MSENEMNAYLANTDPTSFGKNAYMLVYEKKQKKPLKEVDPKSEEIVNVDFKKVQANIPDWIRNTV